jgi:hypothetical protein
MVVGPLAVTSLYLEFSRWPARWDTPASDFAALGIALVLGLASLIVELEGTWQRIIGSVIYIPIATALLTLYGLLFVCFFHGDCL